MRVMEGKYIEMKANGQTELCKVFLVLKEIFAQLFTPFGSVNIGDIA